MAQHNQRGMTTVRAPLYSALERLNLTVPICFPIFLNEADGVARTVSAELARFWELVIGRCPHRHCAAYWSPRSRRYCQTSRPLLAHRA